MERIVENNVDTSVQKKEEDRYSKNPHYNKHPSGQAAWDINEWLTANVAAAYKYVFRRDDKDTPIDNLKKAYAYLQRELRRLDLIAANTCNPDGVVFFNSELAAYTFLYDLRADLLQAEAEMEGGCPHALKFYEYVLCPSSSFSQYQHFIAQAAMVVQDMIAWYDVGQESSADSSA